MKRDVPFGVDRVSVHRFAAAIAGGALEPEVRNVEAEEGQITSTGGRNHGLKARKALFYRPMLQQLKTSILTVE